MQEQGQPSQGKPPRGLGPRVYWGIAAGALLMMLLSMAVTYLVLRPRIPVVVPLSAPQAPGDMALQGLPAPEAPAWIFEGRVYDLMSLRPVAGALIVFKDPSGAIGGQASSDSQGFYRTALASLPSDGYEAVLRHPGYLEKYLDESSPPFWQRERGRRRLAGSPAPNRPWVGIPKAGTRRDLVAIPKSP